MLTLSCCRSYNIINYLCCVAHHQTRCDHLLGIKISVTLSFNRPSGLNGVLIIFHSSFFPPRYIYFLADIQYYHSSDTTRLQLTIHYTRIHCSESRLKWATKYPGPNNLRLKYGWLQWLGAGTGVHILGKFQTLNSCSSMRTRNTNVFFFNSNTCFYHRLWINHFILSHFDPLTVYCSKPKIDRFTTFWNFKIITSFRSYQKHNTK